VELSEVAARAAGENFPVGSVLFPRALRPHIRALYCYARFVDEVGDSFDGDRLAALDELEAEVGAAFEGRSTWPVMRNVEPTIREFDLPREPFLRLIEANRMDQRVTDYGTWEELRTYCVHSADPCGRLVLGVLRRLGEPDVVAASDSVCTGLQLVNFLQDVPRDLELGRVYLPAEDRARLESLRRLTSMLGARLRVEEGDDVAAVAIDVAHSLGTTYVLLGAPAPRRGLARLLHGGEPLLSRLIEGLPGVDIRIVADPSLRDPPPADKDLLKTAGVSADGGEAPGDAPERSHL